MPTIQVDIVSAEGEIYSGNANMVYAPARMGEVGIAPRHAPLMTALKTGVRVKAIASIGCSIWSSAMPRRAKASLCWSAT